MIKNHFFDTGVKHNTTLASLNSVPLCLCASVPLW
jgi:hypothetical protein